MAQSTIFTTKEQKDKQKRKELIEKALTLWARHAEEYRNLPYRYFFLLEEKTRLGLTPNQLPLTEKDWPRIPLFYIINGDEAREWLKQKRTTEIYLMIERIEEAVGYNYAYCSIKEWVKDAKYLVTHAEYMPSSKKVNKKAVLSGGKTKVVISAEVEPLSPWE